MTIIVNSYLASVEHSTRERDGETLDDALTHFFLRRSLGFPDRPAVENTHDLSTVICAHSISPSNRKFKDDDLEWMRPNLLAEFLYIFYKHYQHLNSVK